MNFVQQNLNLPSTSQVPSEIQMPSIIQTDQDFGYGLPEGQVEAIDLTMNRGQQNVDYLGGIEEFDPQFGELPDMSFYYVS